MERRPFSRITGAIYIITALFGLVISIGGLYLLWSTKDQVNDGVLGTVDLITQAMVATTETLQVVVISLDQATTNLDLINKLLVDTSSSLEESQGLVTDTANMVGVDMVRIVDQTQTSLESAGENLKVVDDTLRLISRIPFIGANYTPDIPLQQSFNNVSRSLDPLPNSFANIRQKLDRSATNLGTVQVELSTIASQIGDIQGSINQAREVANEYNLIVIDLRTRLTGFQETLPEHLNLIYLGITGLLVWMLLTQLAMILHGLEMIW